MNKNVKIMIKALTLAVGFVSIGSMLYAAAAPAPLCRSQMAKLRAEREAFIAGIRHQIEASREELRALQKLAVKNDEERARIFAIQGDILRHQNQIKDLQK